MAVTSLASISISLGEWQVFCMREISSRLQEKRLVYGEKLVSTTGFILHNYVGSSA